MDELESIKNMGVRLANEYFNTFNQKLNEFNDKDKANAFREGFIEALMFRYHQLTEAEKEAEMQEEEIFNMVKDFFDNQETR